MNSRRLIENLVKMVVIVILLASLSYFCFACITTLLTIGKLQKAETAMRFPARLTLANRIGFQNLQLELNKLNTKLALSSLTPEEMRIFKNVSRSYLEGMETNSLINKALILSEAFNRLSNEIQKDSIATHGIVTEEDSKQIRLWSNIALRLKEYIATETAINKSVDEFVTDFIEETASPASNSD